jgi:hypothetical protein
MSSVHKIHIFLEILNLTLVEVIIVLGKNRMELLVLEPYIESSCSVVDNKCHFQKILLLPYCVMEGTEFYM